jgi:peptidoglycan/LPS O-acetylase OafA/YrhL
LRIPELDGLRGIAILVVMLHHMTVMRGVSPLDRALVGASEAGAAGVDIFFVLSGFLITGILLDARGSEGYFRNFYARRTLRIFPLYYAVVFVSLVVLPHIPHPKMANFGRIAGDEIWYWTYLSNFSVGAHAAFRHGILDVSWSLAIEEQFYLLWPAIVWFAPRRVLAKICVAGVAVSLGLRLLASYQGLNWITIYVLTPLRMDGLLIGALIAIAAREMGLEALRAPARRVLWVSGPLVALMFLRAPYWREDRFAQTVGYTLLALFAGALLVLGVAGREGGRWRGFLRWRPLVALGTYSYALYLFHLPIRAAIRDVVYGPDQFFLLGGSQLPGQLLFYALALTASFAAALLSWHLYEKQFLKLKVFFPSRSQRVVAAPSGIAADHGAPPASAPASRLQSPDAA